MCTIHNHGTHIGITILFFRDDQTVMRGQGEFKMRIDACVVFRFVLAKITTAILFSVLYLHAIVGHGRPELLGEV